MKIDCLGYLIIAGTFCAGVDVALAEPGDAGAAPASDSSRPYDFYVGNGFIYDSNVFRLPANPNGLAIPGIGAAPQLAPGATRDDFIDDITVGGNGHFTYGAQEIDLNLRADENRYLHNSDINNFSTRDGVVWNWLIGSALSGQLGGDYSQALANYGETLFEGRDLIRAWDYYASARYQFGPHWAVFGGIRDSDATHTLAVDRINDLRTKTANIGIEYAIGAGSTLAFQYNYIDGTFPQGYELDSVVFDRSYTEDRPLALLHYVLSEKTLFDVNVGYVRRSYKTESLGQFSGVVGKVSMQWEPTEKTQLIVSGYRDLQAYLSAESDYFVVTGGSISPVWIASEKLRFAAEAIYERQNYTPSSISNLALGPRHDTSDTQQMSLTYLPLPSLRIKPSFNFVERTSNEAIFSYNDKIVRVDATFTF